MKLLPDLNNLLYYCIMSKINNKKIEKDIEKEKLVSINSEDFDNFRLVSQVIRSERTHDGDGVSLNRSFPNQAISEFDPFLLLDEMGPMYVKPENEIGFPDHPHRGFETVTYLLDGKFEHKDSRGHSVIISAGDVQWMTAGSGIIHSEIP